ncbi:hypothetical protein KIH74_00985 [Kineosporia sp. J2-2]|uniref:Uncharacterized protein n=1 Tax=Kineosporia corallincola TaxID=2835133 RepID=A0ABS5T8T0_9ACTN|nr:hypothetical protein [Kineosporia corallincola]MBT0767476.1 hypothetical protein [Kineosporia corallincola]
MSSGERTTGDGQTAGDEATSATRRAEQTARAERDRAERDRIERDRIENQAENSVGKLAENPAGDDPEGTRRTWPGPSAASSVGQAGADRTAWAGPTGVPANGPGSDPAVGPAGGAVREDQASRPIPVGGTAGTSTGRAAGAATGAPGSASPVTGEDEVYRPADRHDPSVRENFAHDDADRRSGTLTPAPAPVATEEDTRTSPTASPVPSPGASPAASPLASSAPVHRVSRADKVDGSEKRGRDTDTDGSDDGSVDGDERGDVSPVTPISSGRRRSGAAADAVSGHTGLTGDDEWRELQTKFVDDPQATVAGAAGLLERDLAGLRSQLAAGSTEDLRNAFKRYRGLHESLR